MAFIHNFVPGLDWIADAERWRLLTERYARMHTRTGMLKTFRPGPLITTQPNN